MPGYHLSAIPKGVFGEWSKVEEEFAECVDAIAQKNKVMTLIELSDLLGAIDAYVRKQHKDTVTLNDILKMTETTKRAFLNGDRK